ncbi:MAG: hypothetical protein M3N39_04415 [Pseudomonadota bacterium]|nr:hypothetical protein [Pseudomonadota bacterium]
MATALELGRHHPNSPSFTPREDNGEWYPSEAELQASAGRVIAAREDQDEQALARIDTAMLPLKLDAAGKRLDRAIASFSRARGDYAPHLAIDAEAFAKAEREKDAADVAYRALVELATKQKWTDVARRLAA